LALVLSPPIGTLGIIWLASEHRVAIDLTNHMKGLRLSMVGQLALVVLAASAPSAPAPTAKVINGTYMGKYVASFDQDLFLGIQYAQPPVGSLRLRNPQSLNTTFGSRQAVVC
jgi:hypothetical protein